MSISSEHLDLIRPDDWHLHLRDGDEMASVVGATARQFRRALVMPNLKPPVTQVAQAAAYRDRILAALSPSAADLEAFEPMMTLYLTDLTPPSEVERAAETPWLKAFKLYPAGATTHSDQGVTDWTLCDRVFEAMQRLGVVLCVHGEVTRPEVDVFDREARFIEDVLIPLRARYPSLKVVFEHITTQEAVHYVRDAQGPIASTITPQHLLFNRNRLFQGGIRPHDYCLPVLKREVHRQALVQAATSPSPRYFLGTDSAPHAQQTKETSCGCAGCFSAPVALELYASLFDSVGALGRLEAFASFHGADFYGEPRSTTRVRLRRHRQVIPESLPLGPSRIVPLMAGESLEWCFEGAGV